MTDKLYVDYSFARPDPKEIRRKGYIGAIRYLAPESPATHGKILHPTERDALHEAGLGILLVFESTAKRATEGQAAGEADRKTAEQMAKTLGYPASFPIFYAVDGDYEPAKVEDYFQGITAKPPTHKVGVYGSRRVGECLKQLGLVEFVWQTEAWNGATVSKAADLYQRIGASSIPSTDEDVIVNGSKLSGWLPKAGDPKPDPQRPTPHPANPDHDLWEAMQKWARAKGLT